MFICSDTARPEKIIGPCLVTTYAIAIDCRQHFSEEEVNQLMTTLPFYPLRKSIEILPLIKDAEI